MSEKEKIAKARAQLIIGQPFFGTLALRLKMTEDNSIPTACTDGEAIYYNSEFAQSITLNELKGLIAHEVLHCAMLHHARRGTRHPKKWNYACDYAINPILIKAKFELPEGGLQDPIYSNKSAEEIYSMLPPEPPGGGSWDDAKPGLGDVMDAPGKVEGQAVSEAEWKIATVQAAQVAKQAGRLPAELDLFISELLSPQLPWRDILRRFVTIRSKDDYSWARPNRRHIAAGLYLPTAWSESMGPIVLAVDTSGSISQTELDIFSAEINAIVQDTRPSRTYVIYCDTRVHCVEEFSPDEEITLVPHGGGGTDFRPPFDYVENENIEPKCLIYLTDGYGPFPEEPGYPTLWVCTSEIKAPFGETLEIKI